MLPVLNNLVRSARFLTKSMPRQMFTMLGLDQHLKVAYDLICKVSLYPSLICFIFKFKL